MAARPNIVLVHGAWADGSCWSAVIERLQADGYNVIAPQFPESSLADDVARLRQVLDRKDGPTLLAGHSYGGQIMTALGTDAPNVVGLVYIAAFGLDEGESIGALLAQGRRRRPWRTWTSTSRASPGSPRTTSWTTSPADVDPVKARVMFAVQQALSASTLQDVMGVPAWKSPRPGSWSQRTTRPSRPTPSASSRSGWGRPRSRWSPATWPWSRTRPRWPI